MAAKQRAKTRIKQRLSEKLESLATQEELLHSMVKSYVEKIRTRTVQVLGIDDTDHFLQQFPDLEQQLDQAFSTCELLTATAEDMIENHVLDSHENVGSKEESSLLANPDNVSAIHRQSDDGPHCVQEPRSSTPVANSSSVEEVTKDRKDAKISAHSTKSVPNTVKKQLASCGAAVSESQASEKMLNQVCSKKNEEENASKKKEKSSPKKKQKSPKKKHNGKKEKEEHKLDKFSYQSSNTKSKRETKTVTETVAMKKVSKNPEVQNESEDEQREKNVNSLPQNYKGTESSTNVKQVPKAFAIPEDEDFGDLCSSKKQDLTPLGAQVSDRPGQRSGQPYQVYDGMLLSQEVMSVMVSEVVSPWCFFVQPCKDQAKQLMAEIHMYMRAVGLSQPPLQDVHVGSVCLAQFSGDGAFYRAYVLRVHRTAANDVSQVDVLYLDYGNREKVKVTELRKLPDHLQTLPPQAVCCALAEVMPANKYGVWTEGDIVTFKLYLCNQELSCVKVCSSSSNTLPHLVRLVSNYNMPWMFQPISIGQVLINRGSAQYVELTDQINQLNKTGEGREEAAILNGYFLDRPGLRIQEISHVSMNTSCNVSMDTTYKGHTAGNDQEDKSLNIGETHVKDEILDSKKYDAEDVKSKLKENETKHQVKSRSNGFNCQMSKLQGSDYSGSELSKNSNCKPIHVSSDSAKSEKSANKWTEETGLKKDPVDDIPKTDKEPEFYGNQANFTVPENTQKDSPRFESKVAEKSHGQKEKNSSQESFDSGLVNLSDTEKDQNDRPAPLALPPSITKLDSSSAQGYQIMMADIRSPGHFYVHVASQDIGYTLDSLMKNLNHSFERLNRRKLLALSKTVDPTVNLRCCARFSKDNNFYRAEIKSIHRVSEDLDVNGIDKVFVYYIDFGNEEWLPRNRIFPLLPNFSNVPPLATRCHLSFIRPKGGETAKWNSRSTELFMSLVDFEKSLTMHVVQGNLCADNNGNVGESCGDLGVLLVDNLGPEEVCINLELIRQDMAELDSPQGRHSSKKDTVPDSSSEMEMLDSWNPMKDDFLSKRNSYLIDMDDAGVATTGYKAQDERRICRFYIRGQRCFRGDLCPYKHIRNDTGVTLDQEKVYVTSGNQNELCPAVGSWVALEVTTILSPERFYATLPFGGKSLDSVTTQQNADVGNLDKYDCEETLDDLLAALNEEYGKRASFQSTGIMKSLGEIVAARFSEDHQWYRARITKVTEDKVKVFFVDFGNTEWLSDEDIAEIKPEFLHLPFQALECFLYNVEPANQQADWSKEAIGYFREMVDGKTLVGHVRSSSLNNCLTVELFDTCADKDINIGTMLVEKGFAARFVYTNTSDLLSDLGSSRRSSVSSTGLVNFVPG